MPLVSVGMPVYNSEKYLAEALDCICNQTLEDIEIIISDNGSTDSTQAIVKDFMDRDDRIIFHQQSENLGPVPNFRFLLSKARSDYFIWRAYDDLSDPDYLEKLYDQLHNQPQYDLAVGKVVRRKLDGSVAGQKEFPDLTEADNSVRRRVSFRNSHPGWMYGLFRTSRLIPAIDGVLKDYPHIWAWDHLVIAPFAIEGKITGDNSVSFYQRETGISQSTVKPATNAGQIRLIRDFMNYVIKIINQTELPLMLRWQLKVSVIGYTNGRTEKFRRIIRRAILAPFI